MENSSLVELLKTLSRRELKDFLAFAASGYLNRGKYRQEAQTLLAALADRAPEYSGAGMAKEKLHESVFPGEPYSEGRLEKVMVELSKLLRAFLLAERQARPGEAAAQQAAFAETLLERGLDRRAANAVAALLAGIQQKTVMGRGDFEAMYRASSLQREIESRNNTWKKDLNIGEALRQLDLFYFSSRAALVNHALVLQKLAKIDTPIDIEKERRLTELLGIGPGAPPAVLMAKKIFEANTAPPSPALFRGLAAALDDCRDGLGENELKESYAFLRQYASNLINSGHTELRAELFEIQKRNLADGIFYTNGRINPGTYMNIVQGALKANNLDWAASFIAEHRGRIHGDNTTDDYYRLSLAYHLFAKKDFAACLDNIPDASANLNFHLLARRLELKVYYETGSELLPYKLDAFKMYLSRNRHRSLSEGHYEVSNNFINILSQLAQSRPGDPNRRATILRRIEEKKRIISKDWLIEKANGLR